VILLLHNRYRVPGGEERAVEDLAWLIRTELGEDAEILERDSAALGRSRAAIGLLRGGLHPDDVGAAVRRTRARVVHAHNVQPSLGWRALAAARAAGARVVLHLHNYRLVCAVGTCFTRGADCTRCHGRNTLPGVRLNCRGGSRAESAAYGAGLALWQRRIAGAADAFIVPSAFALRRLEQLGAPLGTRAHVIASVQRAFAERSRAAEGQYALYAGRLAPEKGVADAIAACRLARVPLVVAGDGPDAGEGG
jgi:glycosyltransferase involved in cell wall biosynthesis